MITEDTINARAVPDTRPMLVELNVPDSTHKIALVSPDVGPIDRPFSNLVRRDSSGRIVWIGELPDPAPGGYDTYTAVEWADGKLGANSWSGVYVLIDPQSGQILSREFVK